jgi:hypothetical protein
LLGGELHMKGHDGELVPVRHLAKELASQLRHESAVVTSGQGLLSAGGRRS